jgi:hypothetical protein
MNIERRARRVQEFLDPDPVDQSFAGLVFVIFLKHAAVLEYSSVLYYERISYILKEISVKIAILLLIQASVLILAQIKTF